MQRGEPAVVVVSLKEVKVKQLLGQFFTTGILHKIKSRLGAIIIQESMRREKVLMNCQSDQVFEDSNQQTMQATSATSAEMNWWAVRIWIEGFNMHCHSRVQHLQRLHCHHSEAKRKKIIWIQQSQHIFHNLSSYTVFFLLSGYLAYSFRPIDVCMDGTCARLCVYNMMVRWCMYFAFLLKKVCRAFCAILYLHRRMNLAIRTPKMFF